MIKIAFSKTDITPKLPCRLSGFLKERIATKVHDPLSARSILFYDDNINDYYLLTQLDLIATDHLLKDRLSELFHNLIKPEHIILCATHTHAGPMGIVENYGMDDVFGPIDNNYLDIIADRIYENIISIKDDVLPCTISYSHSTVNNVGTERHNPKLPGDESLFYIEFIRQDRRKAFIYNYACHPTVTGPGNIEITKDLPYFTEEHYKDELCIFINSNAGNISTRFTRQSSDFKQLEIYTEELIKAIDSARLNKSEPEILDTINFSIINKTYKLKQFKTLTEAQEALINADNKVKEALNNNVDGSKLRLIESLKEGAAVQLQLVKYFGNQATVNADLTFLQLNNLKIAGIPGELFSTLGTILKQNNIEVFGYTNGYLLYLADKDSYDNNLYEAISSPLIKGTAEAMIQDILDHFKDIE
ncbi:MAG: neutral/alkaline non-lysosomal ceramidase N-terminal domain-containing protein [Erysipelotrichaceae bacterium]